MSINLENQSLENLIKKLEDDNLKISNIIKEINKSFEHLDSSKWSSKEKTNLDSILNPFIDNLDIKVLDYLSECTDMLKLALISYETTDSSLTKDINISVG